MNSTEFKLVAPQVIVGVKIGFTVTVMVNVLEQAFAPVPDVAVTLYTTLVGLVLVLVKVWLILFKTPTVSLLVPVIPETVATVQVYNVFDGTISVDESSGVIIKVAPEQIDEVFGKILGLGLTVTVIRKVLEHIFGAVPTEAVTV